MNPFRVLIRFLLREEQRPHIPPIEASPGRDLRRRSIRIGILRFVLHAGFWQDTSGRFGLRHSGLSDIHRLRHLGQEPKPKPSIDLFGKPAVQRLPRPSRPAAGRFRLHGRDALQSEPVTHQWRAPLPGLVQRKCLDHPCIGRNARSDPNVAGSN